MSNTFRLINGAPIFWKEGETTHIVEGADVHPGVRLLWTLCEIDVPANAAFQSLDGAKINCGKCMLKLVS